MNASASLIIDSTRDLARRVSDFTGTAPDFGQLRDGYARLALAPGSAVLVLAPNSVDFLFHWIAILANGYVPCAIAPSTKASLVTAIRDALDIAAIVGAQLEPALHGATSPTPIGRYQAAVFAGTPAAYEPFDVLMLTTGTSGAQTACVHRLDSLVWNAGRTNERLCITAADRQLVVVPMFHAYGLVTHSIGAIISGCELAIDGPPFNATRFAELVRTERISICGVTPTIARELLRKGAALPTLRSLSIGGDRMLPDEIARLLRGASLDELYVTYGLTEAGPRISVLAAHTAPAHTHDSVGIAFPGITTRIDNPDAAGVGQLLVQTPAACRRRVGKHVARQPFTPDGFLETGDLFTKDAAGYLRYVARASDVLIVKGEKLNVRSIDAVAESHPDVEFARTSPGDAQSLVTRVWARDGRALDLDEIRRFMGRSLRLHELPDTIIQESSSRFHK